MKTKIIGIGIVCLLIIVITMVLIFVKPIDLSTQKKENGFQNWNRSGPFAINKKEYKIGENIFLIAEGLSFGDKGNIVFVFPNATREYFSLPFNSEQKSNFNYYFTPTLSKAKKICSVDQLIGEWTIEFKGTVYEPLKFRIINETIPTVNSFERVC